MSATNNKCEILKTQLKNKNMKSDIQDHVIKDHPRGYLTGGSIGSRNLSDIQSTLRVKDSYTKDVEINIKIFVKEIIKEIISMVGLLARGTKRPPGDLLACGT